MPAIFVLTPGAAQQSLQNDGLNALGLTALALSPHWGADLGGYLADALTLAGAPVMRAPFRGLLEGTFAPANSKLNGDISATDTNLLLIPSGGDHFPSPSGGDSVFLTLASPSSSKQEIVACTARVGDALTVKRGFNGTAKQAFSANDTVSLRLGRGRSSVQFSAADGEPLKMACAVFRLHPQAVLRLEQLMAVRYGAPNRPVPWCMVIRDVEHYKTDQYFDADDNLPVTGTVSFHDGRGLIVDPLYVASVFEDLLGWLPALRPASVMGNVNDAGGIHHVAQLDNTTLIHVVDPHGARFQKAADKAALVTATNAGTPIADVPASGLVTLGAGNRIQADAADNGRMRWGWATNGLLSRAPLTPPALPANVTLNRQFFRVCAVDVEWYLRGNRTSSPVNNVPKDDGRIPPELLPDVRDLVNIDYLVDGPDTLAEATRVLQLPNRQVGLVVSPLLDDTLLTPNARGATAHWPTYPAQQGLPGLGIPTALPPNSVTAAFVSANSNTSNDVVVTLLGIVAPAHAHVRIYPRQFQEILAIGEEPSFLRGDGGANLAPGGGVAVLLPNPFNLTPGQQRPTPATLTMDLVITDPTGVRRMFGNVNANVTNGPGVVPTTPFTGAGGLGTLKLQLQPSSEGLGPSPLFGIPMPAPLPPGNPPTGFINLILSLAAEPSPRQAPRLPMMARFETVAVSGTTGAGAQPPGSLLWEAVVTGARWGGESLSAQHNMGNPGNPAGPDVHAPEQRTAHPEGGSARILHFEVWPARRPVVAAAGSSASS